MLFNSYVFLFLFLPCVLLVFYWLGGRVRQGAAVAWLILASLFFYAWWNPAHLVLLAASVLGNYGVGRLLAGRRLDGHWLRRLVFGAGIALNLVLLGYFKYANFLVENLNWLLGSELPLGDFVLPLAISFFTFQQIAYLVDVYRDRACEQSFARYCLFVTFFPQLIAGPIVHHAEMLPQFEKSATFRPRRRNLEVGLAIVAIGLFKKVVIADGIAAYATPVFAAAENGTPLSFFEAWCGALAYTFQLYFDFSGYSDMAIGLGRLFGIRLPINFNSPYKAANIIDFWRRWHITLSRFLRDYLYIPLGGNRHGPLRRHVNLFLTMLLGGLWHGAGWTFVVWGALHGVYLIANHAWLTLKRGLGLDRMRVPGGLLLARTATFLAVVVGWVVFRAETYRGALALLSAMTGSNGLVLPQKWHVLLDVAPGLGALVDAAGVSFAKLPHFSGGDDLGLLALLLAICALAPNTQQIISGRAAENAPALPLSRDASRLRWRPTPGWAVVMSVVTVVSVLHLSRVSEFLYFQF